VLIAESCISTDNAEGEADSLRITFTDFGLWSKWQPKFGDVIEVKKDGYTTGKMYIDEIIDTDTFFFLNSRSLPPNSRTNTSKTWENVRFTKIASDLAENSGLTLETYGITDYEYLRFDQKQESNMTTLNRLCLLEGYCLKITNSKAVIYNEKVFENAIPTLSITSNNFSYTSRDIGRSKVIVKWFDGDLIQGSCEDALINAEIETVTTPVYSVAQAERWSKGILRQHNKKRFTGQISIEEDLTVSAGNTITTPKGDFFIFKVEYDLIGSKSRLWLRKKIEGVY